MRILTKDLLSFAMPDEYFEEETVGRLNAQT